MNLFSKRPLALLTLLFLLASLFAYLINASGMSRLLGLIPLCVFLLTSILLAVLRRKGRSLLPLVMAAVLLLGFLTQCLYDDLRHRPWKEADAGAPHILTATVTDYEQSDGITYTLSVDELDGRAVRFSLLLFEKEGSSPHKIGTRLRCYASVLEKNNRFYYRNGIAGTATALDIAVLGHEERPLSDALLSLRTRLSDRIRKGMNGDAASLTIALLLGDRAGLPASLSNDFQRTGLSHMLALSGLHLSILAMLLLRLLHGLGTPRFISFPILIVFLVGYTAVSGFPLSLIRAALMLAVAELARLLRLFSDSVTSLFLSVGLIVFFSPSAIADIGLLLSFLATLGILTALEVFPRRPRSFLGKILYALLLSLLSTVFAIAFTLPVTAVIFEGVSLISPLSNLLISPLLHLILMVAPFLLLFPSVLSPISQFLGNLAVSTVTWLSEIRGVYLFTSYPLFLAVLLLFSLYLLLLLLRKTSRRGFLLRFLPSVVILISVLLGCHITEANEGMMLYTRRDTEEYLILRKDGRTAVINRAERAGSLYRLKEELTAHHIPEVDLLVLTCYTADTASYLEELAEHIPVKRLLAVPPIEETIEYRSVIYTAKRLEIPCDVKETIQENGDFFGFVNIESDTVGHHGLFMRASYGDTVVCYASQGYLKTVNKEALDALLAGADLLILGAHAATDGRDDALSAPPNLTVVVASPEAAPPYWQKEKEGVVLSPDTFVYPLP